MTQLLELTNPQEIAQRTAWDSVRARAKAVFCEIAPFSNARKLQSATWLPQQVLTNEDTKRCAIRKWGRLQRASTLYIKLHANKECWGERRNLKGKYLQLETQYYQIVNPETIYVKVMLCGLSSLHLNMYLIESRRRIWVNWFAGKENNGITF